MIKIFLVRTSLFISVFGLLLVASCNSGGSDHQSNNEQPINTNGYYKEHFPSGKIKEEGLLVENERSGVWKSYDETGNLKEAVYYYKGEKIADLDPVDFDLETFYDTEKHLSIDLPKDWNVKKDFKESLLIAVKPLDNAKEFSPNINVLRFSLPDTISLEEAVNLNVADLRNSYEEIKFKEQQKITINSTEAIRVIYFVKHNDLKLGAITTYFSNKGNLYLVSCLANAEGDNFVKYKDLFLETTQTFKFIK